MADETGDSSCHGQLKCEGIYQGGLFKTLKIYRLFDVVSDATSYTRCKGVNRFLADKLADLDFDPAHQHRAVISRTCLRPTASGQMALTQES